MEIDYDYLKAVLEGFTTARGPTTDIEQLRECGLDYTEDRFVFHMAILNDQGFIRQPDGDSGFGVFYSVDNHVAWSVLPLRLTASGHEFLDGLRNEQAMTVVKTKFKTAGLETVKTIFKTILEESVRATTKTVLGP